MNKKKTNQTADAEAAEQNKQPTVESLQKQIDEMQLQMTVIAEMLKEVIKKSPKRQSNKTKQQKQSNDS